MSFFTWNKSTTFTQFIENHSNWRTTGHRHHKHLPLQNTCSGKKRGRESPDIVSTIGVCENINVFRFLEKFPTCGKHRIFALKNSLKRKKWNRINWFVRKITVACKATYVTIPGGVTQQWRLWTNSLPPVLLQHSVFFISQPPSADLGGGHRSHAHASFNAFAFPDHIMMTQSLPRRRNLCSTKDFPPIRTQHRSVSCTNRTATNLRALHEVLRPQVGQDDEGDVRGEEGENVAVMSHGEVVCYVIKLSRVELHQSELEEGRSLRSWARQWGGVFTTLLLQKTARARPISPWNLLWTQPRFDENFTPGKVEAPDPSQLTLCHL